MSQSAWNADVRSPFIDRCVVTAEQMQAIESRLFDAGMPVAALMDKVAGLIARRIQALYPVESYPRVLVLVGPGHNGGDALVVARELHEQGYRVARCHPISKLKPLTQAHSDYADHLGIPTLSPEAIQPDSSDWDWVIDGLFGFGLTRPLEGAIATLVNILNAHPAPLVSIDLPSGLDTNTGTVLGTAIHATYTLCLGLWKRSLLQDSSLDVVGQTELVDFGLPLSDIQAVLGEEPQCQRLTKTLALAALPLPRKPDTYKYKEGHLLLVCGSSQYMGAAILAARAARASGVGMLSVAVPDTLKPILVGHLPDGLVIGCPEDETGAIAHFPESIDLGRYSAIACGPGLTLHAELVVRLLLDQDVPLLLDADGLNVLAGLDPIAILKQRRSPTILTPHVGEFRRLFSEMEGRSRESGVGGDQKGDRLSQAQAAARQSQALVILKGAQTVIAAPDGSLWVNPHSTPALARGGSGDVLTGLLAGLLAQNISHQQIGVDDSLKDPMKGAIAAAQSAVWWHAQSAIAACRERTVLGVDASCLVDFLSPTLENFLRMGAIETA
ncbi:MAG: NAD(P)H-hydrate dehydratase [Elainellaceae cyanobacterium]